MLVIDRRPGEAVLLTGGVRVVVIRSSGNKVRLGFEAPPDVQILREELGTPAAPLAKDMPPQPGDDLPVNPDKPDGPKWGQLFGRSGEPPPAGEHNRSVKQVLAAQRSPVGCCNAYADYSGCSCLADAYRRQKGCPECGGSGYAVWPGNGRNKDGRRCGRGCAVACSICRNPDCANPGGQH